jgi:hypothetical protein
MKRSTLPPCHQAPSNTPREFSHTRDDWRRRARSHKANLLELLRARGAVGVRSDELYAWPTTFGRSPRNRIADLRAEGFVIETQTIDRYSVRYVLRGPGADPPRPGPVVERPGTTGSLFEEVNR